MCHALEMEPLEKTQVSPAASTSVGNPTRASSQFVPSIAVLGVWKKWNALNAYGLHALQLSIALKGVRLTQVGGFFCYSTCSMNPIENESVVAELLRASEGSLELVDRRSELPGLLARPGMSTWRVLSEEKTSRQIEDKKKKNKGKMTMKELDEKKKQEESTNNEGEGAGVAKDAQEVAKPEKGQPNEDEPERVPVRTEFKPASMDDTELKKMAQMAGLNEYSCPDEVPLHMQKRVRRSCFPPTVEEASRFHLERCMRVLPQDMDTGGFFVALLEKKAPISARARKKFQKLEEELLHDSNNTQTNEEPLLKKAKVDSEAAAVDNKVKDTEMKDSITGEGANLVPDEKNNSAVVRGHVKKHYLEDKDGKKHATLGKDDFIPISKELFQPLKGTV